MESTLDKMTVIYSKNTGIIHMVIGGEQDLSVYGVNEVDIKESYDYIVIDHDPYVFNNHVDMEVIDGELKIKQESIPNKYL